MPTTAKNHPCTAPTTRPSSSMMTSAISGGTPCLTTSTPSSEAASPPSCARDRSISPRSRMRLMPRARIARNATWVERLTRLAGEMKLVGGLEHDDDDDEREDDRERPELALLDPADERADQSLAGDPLIGDEGVAGHR